MSSYIPYDINNPVLIEIRAKRPLITSATTPLPGDYEVFGAAAGTSNPNINPLETINWSGADNTAQDI